MELPPDAKYQEIVLENNLSLSWIGPPLEEGMLPAFFYFSLGGKQSLTLDPFHQIVCFLASPSLRIFSFDLPFHEEQRDPVLAPKKWAEVLEKGEDPFSSFFEAAEKIFSFLLQKQSIAKKTTAIGGLSRGAFFALHLSAKHDLPYILGLAPMTQLPYLKEFHSLSSEPILQRYDLFFLSPILAFKKIRFFMGNRDKRVGTEACFHLFQQYVETAFEQKIRSPQMELFLYPSVGHLGHGTSLSIFQQGANWVHQCLFPQNL